jgi:hypothetical protein
MVVLVEVRPELLDNLPEQDQEAIRRIVGMPVRFEAYDEAGRAELMFVDRSGTTHSLDVGERLIRAAR